MRWTTLSISARKRRPKPGASASYQSCASLSSARAASVKRNRPHLGATLLKFGFEGFPGDGLGAVIIERRQTALELGLLRRRPLDLVVLSRLSHRCAMSESRSSGERRGISSWVSCIRPKGLERAARDNGSRRRGGGTLPAAVSARPRFCRVC